MPSYSDQYGGFVVTSTINKYIYLVINRRFEAPVRASYSITEISPADNIKHPVIRESLKLLGLKSNLEIISIPEVPSKTGLGSSSCFTVGLLHALHTYKDEFLSRQDPSRGSLLCTNEHPKRTLRLPRHLYLCFRRFRMPKYPKERQSRSFPFEHS